MLPAAVPFAKGADTPTPLTAQVRESDVVADWTAFRPGSHVQVTLVLECKNAPDPWVILSSDDGELVPPETMLELCFCEEWPGGRDRLRILGEPTTAEVASSLIAGDVFGHSLVTAFGGKDVAYAAVMGAFAGAQGMLDDADHDGLNSLDTHVAWVVIPMVVTSGPLFRASLGEDGEVDLVTIDYGVVVMRPSAAPVSRRCIVVTEKGLPGVLERAQMTGRLLLRPPGTPMDQSIW